MDEREQLLALAKNCTPLLTRLAQTENEYMYLCSKNNKFKKHLGWIVLGLIVCPFLVLGALVDIFTNSNLKSPLPDVIGMLICLALTGLCILAIVNRIKRKERQPIIEQELDKIHNDPSLSWLPSDYRNSIVAGKIIEYLANMRAKTLQEALNLLETEMHQARLEQEVENIKIVNNHYHYI